MDANYIMNKRIFLLLAASLLIAGKTVAQTSESFVKAVIGNWQGKGTLFNQEASFHMKWENALSSKFVKLTFKNSFKDKSGVDREMNAHAYYRLMQNTGYWFDSRGIMLPLTLEISENSMTVLWGDASSERGKTIYSIDNLNHISVQDFVLKGGSYALFGEATYKRSEK